MAQNLTNFDAVLKEWYEGSVRDILNSEIFLLKTLSKEDGMWAGNNVIFPVNVRRNEGVGARSDGGTLPSAQNEVYQESQIGCKYNYGRIQVTGPTIKASQNDRGAFARAVGSEIKLMVRNLKNDINRQMFGDGTGALAMTNGAGSATTALVVDTPGSRFLRGGMVVDVYTATSGGAQEVDSIAISTDPVSRTAATFASAQTWGDDSYVFREDSRGLEMMGIRAIVDDGTLGASFQNINRTTYPRWRGNILGNSGTNRALTLDLMQRSIDTASELGNGEIDLIVAHYSARREYIRLLSPDVRYAPLELRGGFKTLVYAGGADEIPFHFDKDADYNRIYFLDTSSLKVYRQSDFYWADEDGAILSRVSNQDAFEAFLKFYANLGCDAPNKNSRLDDITVSGLVL
jgi:hypothetical protein